MHAGMIPTADRVYPLGKVRAAILAEADNHLLPREAQSRRRIAGAVVRRLPDPDRNAVLIELMAIYVETVLGQTARHTFAGTPHPLTARPATEAAVTPPPGRSRRERSLSRSERFLASCVVVGPGGPHVLMGDLTAGQCKLIAQAKRTMAAGYNREARRYDDMADTILTAGVPAVRELDQATIDRLSGQFGGSVEDAA